MANLTIALNALERMTQGLAAQFVAAQMGQPAVAIYAPSLQDADAVFAISHAGGNERRADQYIYRRRFHAEESVAAQSWTEQRDFCMPSRMFPNQHMCAQIILPKRAGVMQLAFEHADMPDFKDIKKLLLDMQVTEKAAMALRNIFQVVGDQRDQKLCVKDAYAPNKIVLYCDINGFSKLSEQYGYYRAQDFATAFCQDFVRPLAQSAGAELLRYEGDGLWLALPADAVETAQSLGQEIAKKFRTFVQDYPESRFQGSTVKVIMEHGEITPYFWQDGDKPDDLSGPVFTRIRQASKGRTQSDRSRILVGPELMAHLNL